jgi:hypothetical protein
VEVAEVSDGTTERDDPELEKGGADFGQCSGHAGLCGGWRELSQVEYELSPGTVYPMLHRMQRHGYLTSRERRDGRSIRRSHRATAAGRAALREAKRKVQELFAELLET